MCRAASIFLVVDSNVPVPDSAAYARLLAFHVDSSIPLSTAGGTVVSLLVPGRVAVAKTTGFVVASLLATSQRPRQKSCR